MTASPQGNGLRIAVDASGNRHDEIHHATSALGFLAIAALREPDGGLPDGTEAPKRYLPSGAKLEVTVSGPMMVLSLVDSLLYFALRALKNMAHDDVFH